MAGTSRIVLLATLFSVGTTLAASAPTAATYILNGYDLSGIHGINAAELEAKLMDKPGVRITQADIHADTKIVAEELEARHIKGQLFTTLAKKNGHVWIIFDLLNPTAGPQLGSLESQNFEGASSVPASALAAGSGLKTGDQLTQEKLLAARRAIVATYAKAMPGRKIALKVRLQHRLGDKTILTWIIGEPE
jgi:outer membrane protein assembly factor BamA